MEEGDVGAQIRVVRCPKCEILLPEMPNYSVYLCGNCGATLQARKLNQASDSSPEKSDEENVKYLEILDSQSDKKKNPSPNPVNKLIKADNQTKKPEPIMQKEPPPVGSPVKSNSIPMNPNSSTSIPNSSLKEQSSETIHTKYRRTHKVTNTNSVQSKESIFDEGPSDYNNPNPNPQIETLEQDRANLLRMLEEIRDQVQKSCEISGKQNPGNPNPGIQNPVLATRVPEPSRNRSGYNVGIPNYYPHNNNNNNYAWRNPDNYYYPQFEPDPLISYHHEGFYHQPSCACLHCFPREVPVPVPTHRPVSVPYQLYHQNPFSNPRSSNNSPNLVMRQSYNNNRRNFARRNCRQCQPIAGASPFVVCYNCFELLQVPKRSPLCDNKKAQVKLRCGSCSHAMILKLDGNELVVENNEKEDERNVSNYANKFASYNFLLGNYENATGSERSRSEASSKDMENGTISRVPSLPLREHLNNSFSENGNISARSEQEKAVLFAENFKQNSVKDVPVVPVPGELVPTEMDLSADEYPHPGLSQESFEGGNNEEERQAGTKNGTVTDNSFFTNFFKKSFKGGNNAKARVSVNGYVISDKVLKKAEKFAGPISPGDYWYDYRCGFWGVMGYHCLGMIPPYIEEFNYPLQRNCAGGNTNVVVNGRELQKKDLELLTGRGLPDASGFSYRVEASGKVWDESTGEELYNLGKLAPTVEKMRRGFGMRVPRVIS